MPQVKRYNPITLQWEAVAAGTKGDQGDQGIQGPTGPTGPTGPQGETALFKGDTPPGDTSLIWVDTASPGVAGDVVGPASATPGGVPLFANGTGKSLTDGPVPAAPNGLATLDAEGLVPQFGTLQSAGLGTPINWPVVTTRGDVVLGPSGYSTINNTSFSVGLAKFTPVYVPWRCEATYIIFQCTIGGAGALLQVALYDDNNGVPLNKIADGGSVDMSTAATKAVYLSNTPELAPGQYWIAEYGEANPSGARREAFFPQSGLFTHTSRLVIQLPAYLSLVGDLGLPSVIDPATLGMGDNSDGGSFYAGVQVRRPT